MPRPPAAPLLDPAIPELLTLRGAADELGVDPQRMRYSNRPGGIETTWGLQPIAVGRVVAYLAADIAAVSAGRMPVAVRDVPALMGATAAAEALAVPSTAVAEHARRGRIPTRRVGNGNAFAFRSAVIQALARLVAVERGARGTERDESELAAAHGNVDSLRVTAHSMAKNHPNK